MTTREDTFSMQITSVKRQWGFGSVEDFEVVFEQFGEPNEQWSEPFHRRLIAARWPTRSQDEWHLPYVQSVRQVSTAQIEGTRRWRTEYHVVVRTRSTD